MADTLSRPPSGTAAGNGSELPLRGTVRADRGDKDKIKLSLVGQAQIFSGGTSRGQHSAGDRGGGRLRRPRSHQGACPLTQRAASSTSLQVEKRVVGGVELLCDVSRGGVRLLVPLVDRPAAFAAFHGLVHVGTRATKRLIAPPG